MIPNFTKKKRAKLASTKSLLMILLAFVTQFTFGQAVPFTGSTYTQDFQSITATALTPATISNTTMLQLSSQAGGGTASGWYMYQQASGTPRWGRSNGSSSTGSFYGMYDGAGTPNSAFGAQGSASIVAYFGVVIRNTTGATITSVNISYDAMMNRNPSTTVNAYPVSYRTSATNIVNTSSSADGTFNDAAGTWINSTSLSFTTPTTGTGAPGTQAVISPLFRIGGAAKTATLTGLNWGNNEYLYIRWKETDEGGPDATAGVDNFSLSVPVIAPVITSANAANSNYGTAATYTITASNTPTSYDATLNPTGPLPTGFSIASNVLSIAANTPAGTYSILTSATNGGGTGTQVLTYTVDKVTPTITVTGLSSYNFTGSPQGPITYNSPAVGGGVASTGAVTFSYVGTGATAYGPSATLPSAVGTYTATATIASDVNYNTATSAAFAFSINSLLNQTITFNPIPTKTYGDAAFALSATGGGSGNPVTFVSSDPLMASISGSTVTILKAGSVTITASQAGNGSYNPATDVTQTLTINQLGITISGVTAANKPYDGNNTATLSGGSLVGVLVGDLANVSFTAGIGTFTSINVGTGITVNTTGYVLTGSASANYILTAQPAVTADITQASQTITFGAIPTKSTGDVPFALTATASSGLAVSYISSNPAVATILGNTVTIIGAGTSTITASQAGNTNYTAAANVQQTLTVTAGATPLFAGDIAIIGYHTSCTPDIITILVMKTLSAGTTFYINDNEVSVTGGLSFADLGEMEASFTVKTGQSIPAGTIITLPWGAVAVSTTTYDWSSTSGAGLGNNAEELYIYQATSISSSTATKFIYGVNIGTGTALVASGLTSGTTFITPTGTASRYKVAGAVYSGSVASLLTVIGNTAANWETHSSCTMVAADWPTFTIGTAATLSNYTTQPSGTITQGSNDVVLAGFNVSANSSTDFTSVTVSFSGSETELTSIRIFRDFNNDGIINGADASVSGAGSAYGASVTFTITGETTFSASRGYLIVANVSNLATAGNTVTASVGSGAFVTTSSTNTGSATGNSRTVAALAAATQLAITNINPASPFQNTSFSVTIQAQDAFNVAQNVAANTDVTISLTSGTGALTGTLSGTILAGTNSVTITGLSYNVAESGVSVTATRTLGDVLSPVTSSTFTVQGVATSLAFVNVPAIGQTGTPLASFTVEARKDDNTVDANYTGAITISQASGPGAISGTLTTNAIAGVATFPAVQFSTAGSVTMNANAIGLTQATSPSVTINVAPSVTEIILPQYAVNGTTAANRLQYICRLQLNDLSPNATYKYYTGASTSATITTATAPGNFFAINNTPNAFGNIVGQTSSKNITPTNGVLMNNDEFTTSGRYAEFTTDATGKYTGWFAFVPTGNAVFTAGSNVYFYVQMNNGNGLPADTLITQSLRSTNTINIIAGGTTGSAIRGTSSATPENPIFLYDNTAGTGRPLYGTWAENDGITSNFATWYGSVEPTNGSWGAYLPNALPNGLRRIEQRDIATGLVAGCAATDANGTWPTGSVNTVNPTNGLTPLVISSTDASLVCPILNTITTGAITTLTYCIDAFNGQAVNVPFTSTDVFGGANVYTAQLSNASGSFASPVNIGTLNSTANSGTISATIPAGTAVGTGYRIRVISSLPPITGTDNGSDIAIIAGTIYYADLDGDTYGDNANTIISCTTQPFYVSISGDCDDFDPTAYPGATEVCDLIDNNCNTVIDEGVTTTFYADVDNDTYGNPSSTIQACTVPAGYSVNNTDCNDASSAVNPGATELCNGFDDNCNTVIDEGCTTYTFFADTDGDTYGDAANSTTILVNVAPSGYVSNNTDCNDANAAINPGATEICNGIDDNCNLLTDDGLTFTNYYTDGDTDGFGGAFLGSFCSPQSGAVTVSGDCDDTNASINPSAIEICNNLIDDNCNFSTDETTLAASFTAGTIACNGGSASVVVSATGGVSPYAGIGTFTQFAGTQTYTVTDAATCTSTITVTLTEPAAISITSFAPASATRGSNVILTGTGFTGVTAVQINGVNATTFTVNSNTQITATVPVTATSGLITVVRGACSANSLTTLSVIGLTEVIFPQFIQGLNGTNNNRLPFAYRATLTGLTANATYRFYNGVELTTASLTSSGAGNSIFANAAGFVNSTTPSLSTVGGYGEFTTDATGNYTGWFVISPSGNATRFVPGTILYTRITLNNGAGGTTAAAVLTSTKTIKVINLVAAAGANNGTGLKGNSSATPKNFVFAYDNTTGTGRPLSGTFVENDGATLPTSFAAYYLSSVDGVNGAYGMIIPNTNTNGVQRIEQRDFTTGALTGCPATDADGIWPSGANTVNPTTGTTPVAITTTDANLEPTTNTTTASACDTYSWSVNGTTYTTSGSYTSVIGCATEILNLTITPSTSNTTTASACDTYTWSVNGTTYTASGSYSNIVGCNTEILNLTITPSTSNTTTVSVCDSYAWSVNGTTYTVSGLYTSVTGCVTEILDLTILTSGTNTTTASACDTYTWSVNGTTFTTSGTYSSVTGCSTEILNLTITPSTSNTTSASACDTYTWSVNGTTYTTSGSYTSVTGCATQILNLTITPSTTNTTTISACDTYTWSVNGATYTTSGSYTSVTGCATQILNLTITPSTSNTTTASACVTYTWSVNGTTYTASGSYTSVIGCATEILNLTITPGSTNTTTASACGSYTWSVNGTTYTASGTYSSVIGCTIEVLNLTIVSPVTISSFTPANAGLGTTVTITGTNFTGTSTVQVNGVAVPTFTVVNATTITFAIPAGSTSGFITVINAGCPVTSTTALSIISLTEIIVPQYIQGVNGTNANRIPYAYYVTLNNLKANSTYRYFNQVVLSTEALTSSGAGNVIFANPAGFVRSTSPSVSSAGNFGTFTTNATGNYTGWFITESTGNVTRFIPGNDVFMRIMLNDGGTGTTVVSRVTATSPTRVINLVTGAGANNGTGLRGNSAATARNFVVTYDNTTGTGRPISATFVESDGTANTTANSFAAFYNTSVEGVAGAYGLITPNTNTNGIQRVEQRDITTGAIVGCPAVDGDGVWPSGANTVNPTSGTTAIALTNTDAFLGTFTASATATNATCFGATDGTVSVTATGGSTPFTYLWSNGATIQNITSVGAGTYSVTVTSNGGCVANASATVNEPAAIVVSSFAPTNGAVGSSVVITGSGFTGATSVSFNGTAAITYTVDNDLQITATVPAGATTGTVTVNFGPCSGTSTGNFTVISTGTLNLKAYIQGYLDVSTTTMAPVTFNQTGLGSLTEADNITVEFHDATAPYGVAATSTVMLNTNGTATVTIPGSLIGGNYYIAIKHRSALETWSANPVALTAVTNYDFTTSSSQAFGDNMVEGPVGVWSLYTGDVDNTLATASQDGLIDLSDFLLLDIDVQNFSGGYVATDLNGNGLVDLDDFLIQDANVQNFISTLKPQ